MVFNTLAEALNSIQVLESANTSVCLTDTDNNIIYETTRKAGKRNTRLDDSCSF